jgi:hypothetical protein
LKPAAKSSCSPLPTAPSMSMPPYAAQGDSIKWYGWHHPTNADARTYLSTTCARSSSTRS